MLLQRIYKTLAGLLDVFITSPADGQVLKYNGSAGKWVNGSAGAFLPLSGGTLTGQLTGSGGNTFDDGSGNMTVDGQLSLPSGYLTTVGVQLNLIGNGVQIWGGGAAITTENNLIDNGSTGDASILGILNVSGVINAYGGITGESTNFDQFLNLHFTVASGADYWSITDDNTSQQLFRVYSISGVSSGNGKVLTLNNTVDDGSGNQIVAGNITTSGKVFIHAGATLYAVASGSLFEVFSNINSTTSTSSQDLSSHTLPAGLLAGNGDKVRFTAVFSIPSNARTKTIGVSAFGTSIFSAVLTTNQSGIVVVDVLCTRASATVVRCVAYPSAPTALVTVAPVVTDVTGLTLTNTQILKTTCTVGSGATAGDVVVKMDVVESMSYSGN